jgi:hypothetical protein
MKKVLILAVVLMMLPLNAMALEMLNDQNMDQITGQAGVSIAVDDVKIYQNISDLSYTDVGGTGTTDGTISLGNLSVMVDINAITRLDATGAPVSPGRDVQGTYNTTNYSYLNAVHPVSGADIFQARALTIDVGNMPVLGAGASYNADALLGNPQGTNTLTMAGVQIGLPTLEIYQTALSFDVTVTTDGTAHNEGASFGRLDIGNQTIAILDGTLEIAPH